MRLLRFIRNEKSVAEYPANEIRKQVEQIIQSLKSPIPTELELEVEKYHPHDDPNLKINWKERTFERSYKLKSKNGKIYY